MKTINILLIIASVSLITLTQAACPDNPTPFVYTGFPADYVTSSKTSTNKLGVVKNVLGNPIYQDRTYNYVDFPVTLYQAAFGSLYNDDKSEVTNSYVTYSFSQPFNVWIAFDSRGSIPTWAVNLGFQQTNLKLSRQDNVGTLIMNIYTNSKVVMNITLGGAVATGANSMYIPFFTLASYSCSAESFSDNFFGYSPPMYQGVLQPSNLDGLYLGFQYYKNYWEVAYGEAYAPASFGLKIAVTNNRYSSTTFTLQTKARGWNTVTSSSLQITNRFVFGTPGDFDPFYPESSVTYPIYALVWNSTASQLFVTYTDYSGYTILGSTAFNQNVGSTNYIKLEKSLTQIKVYVSTSSVYSSTPTLTVNDNNQIPLGRFGWISDRYLVNDNSPQVYVDYLHMTGRACIPFAV